MTTTGHRLSLEPLCTMEQWDDLRQAAAADGHAALAPSHVVLDGKRIVGCTSIGSISYMNVWLDSRRVRALDSFRLLRVAEQEARALGMDKYLIGCTQESPFHPHMERMGFKRLGWIDMHYRKL